MFRLSKKSDYGLIALKHLAQHAEESVSAREIAAQYHIPAEFLAKSCNDWLERAFSYRSKELTGDTFSPRIRRPYPSWMWLKLWRVRFPLHPASAAKTASNYRC